jgi:hypothetical protein
MSPAKTGEAREITVSGDQFTSMFDRERGEIRIGHKRTADICAQRREDIPMRRLGTIITARGQSTSRWQNAIATSDGDGGSKIFGL